MPGNITRRGKTSWRLKYEGGDRDPLTGKRRTRFVNIEVTMLKAGYDALFRADESLRAHGLSAGALAAALQAMLEAAKSSPAHARADTE